tara:strand:+ start:1052 stop:1393 length:342 start_codon:yes stop_codon:yes gene_type:complete
MPKGPTDLTKLAVETSNLINSQQEDFSIGQVAIMNIMICISRFIEERGEAAGIALLQVCMAAIANGQQEVDVTGVPGFMPENDQENDVVFKMEDDLLKEDNVVYMDFNQDDEN